MNVPDQNGWLKAHSYLEPLASVQARVDAKLAGIPIAKPSIPEWDGYVEDFHAGIPLLDSSKVRIDLEPSEKYIALLTRIPLPIFIRLQDVGEKKTLEAAMRCQIPTDPPVSAIARA